MNTAYFSLLIFLWISPLVAMTKSDKQQLGTMGVVRGYQLIADSYNQLATQISKKQTCLVGKLDDRIQEAQRAITLTCNGPVKYTQQQKKPASLITAPQSEEQMPPTRSTPTVFIPEPKGLYPADGQEQPLPEQNNVDASVTEDINTEGLVALFMNKSPQYLPAFLKFCGANNRTINPTLLAQELEKAKSLEQQQPQ